MTTSRPGETSLSRRSLPLDRHLRGLRVTSDAGPLHDRRPQRPAAHHPSYQFWILNPGSARWQLAQDYTPSATLTWSTTGKAAGTYRFSIWARDASSAGTYFNAWAATTPSQQPVLHPVTPAAQPSAFPLRRPSHRRRESGHDHRPARRAVPPRRNQFLGPLPAVGYLAAGQPYSTGATFDGATTAYRPEPIAFPCGARWQASRGRMRTAWQIRRFNSGQLYS